MEFYLTENQLKHESQWIKSKKPLYSGAIGGRYAYCFAVPFKFGSRVIVEDCMDSERPFIDLTEFAEPSENIENADHLFFRFDEKASNECQLWMGERMKDGKPLDGRFQVLFAPTSLGCVCKVKDLASEGEDAELDLTDYDGW